VVRGEEGGMKQFLLALALLAAMSAIAFAVLYVEARFGVLAMVLVILPIPLLFFSIAWGIAGDILYGED
jgi:hypothetical protein